MFKIFMMLAFCIVLTTFFCFLTCSEEADQKGFYLSIMESLLQMYFSWLFCNIFSLYILIFLCWFIQMTQFFRFTEKQPRNQFSGYMFLFRDFALLLCYSVMLCQMILLFMADWLWRLSYLVCFHRAVSLCDRIFIESVKFGMTCTYLI